jgi:hypothetical protein
VSSSVVQPSRYHCAPLDSGAARGIGAFPKTSTTGSIIDRLAWLIIAAAIAGCAALGPPAIYLSRSEIGERAFIDRSGDLSRVFRQFEGLDISGPDVGFQAQAQRVELGWSIRLKEAPLGVPLTMRVAISGRPELNVQSNGIDLVDSRIEEIRLPSIPFVNLDTRQTTSEGEALGRLPLLAFRPEELNREGIIYRATGLSLGTFGLRVDLAPK